MKKKIFAFSLALLMISCVLPFGSMGREAGTSMAVMAQDAKMIKSGLLGDDIRFSATDFKQALGIRNFSAVTITSLPDPAAGVLKYAGVRVTAGQAIKRTQLYLLKFVPANAMVKEGSFGFTCDDYVGGEEITCEVKWLEKINYEPKITASSLQTSLSTGENISLYGTISSEDPEGDEVTLMILTYPKNGTLSLSNASSGSYCYTPRIGYTGKDSFTCVVRDAYGNFSPCTTVNIHVTPKESTLVYADLQNHPAQYPALVLAQENFMLGELSGDGMYFHPDRAVTRGEFVVMVMKAVGISPILGLENSSFDDNASIPASIRNYVATAQKMQYVNGVFDGSGLYFKAEDAITRAEAAVIVDRILDPTHAVTVSVFADSSEIPAWARSAVSTLYDLGILTLTQDGTIDPDATLTRGEAAQMVYSLLRVTKNR